MFERLIWVVPLAVAALGAWRPRAGLLALAAALPLFGSPPGGPYLGALDVAGIAAIATAWRGGRGRPGPLTWPVAAFVAVSLATLVPSPYLPPSWRPSVLAGLLAALPGVESWLALYTWRAAADLLLGWGLFLAVRRAFAGRSAQPLALALGAGLGVALLAGILSQAGLIDLGGFRPQYDHQSPNPRLYSLFFLSGWFSEYIVLVAPVAIAALQRVGRRPAWLTLPFAALAVACLALTQQRAGIGAAALQAVFFAAVLAPRRLGERRQLLKASLAVAALLGLTVLLFVASGSSIAPLVERTRSFDLERSPRAPILTAAVELARARPLSGWSLGAFAPAFDLAHPVGSEGWSLYRNTAHNLYLQIAAERGLPGLLASALLVWCLASCLRRPRAGQETLALALAVSLVGGLVYGAAQYLFHLRSIAWLCWILIGCVAVTTRREASTGLDRAAQALLLVALLLIPVRLLAGERPHFAGDREIGLGAIEGPADDPFRWTGGFAATRLPWQGETLVLTLANGHPKAGERPLEVEVGIAGVPVATLAPEGSWQEHRIEVGPPRAEWVVLTLRVSTTFRPFSDYRRYPDLQPALDIRSLGVAMKQPRWE